MESASITIVYNVIIIFLISSSWNQLVQSNQAQSIVTSTIRIDAFFQSHSLLLILLIVNNYPPLINCLTTSRHTVAAIPGDLVLGALFPVHHAPGAKQAQFRLCGDIREQYGIQRIEAAFQTIDKINADKEILPNITLGIEIRDSCWYSPIALEQSIEFIRDAMAASDERSDTDKSDPSSSSSSSSPTSFLPESVPISHSPLFPMLNAPFHLGSRFNASYMCPKQVKKVKNLVGVIGPASSSVTIQVQNLLQLFAIPQIGYSATSKDLSLKSHYMYFLRVVPSDELQAKVMVDLITQNNWTYISAVYTDGNYGSSLMEIFKNLAQDVGVCLANTEVVTNNAEDEKFDEIVTSILQIKSVKVVACFCEGMTVRGILKAIRRLNATGKFLMIGSDGWADRYDIVEGYEVEASGGISVRIHSPYVTEFDPYYFNLHPDNNTRNPWFKEFWEFKFNCSLTSKHIKDVTSTSPSSSSSSSQQPALQLPFEPNPSYNRQCSGNETLRDRYKQDAKLAFVIKSIWTMAYGLHNMQKKLCPHSTNSCPAMLPVNGSIFLHHLLNVSFFWHNETVSFNEMGDPPGRYDLMNFQRLSDGTYDYNHVGSWDSHSNQLLIMKPFQWPSKTLSADESTPKSVCSKPCEKGYAKNIQSDSVKCCWVCVPCQKNQFLRDEYNCENCPLGWWPNENQTGCFQIEIEYIQWTETPSLVAIAIALFGIMLTFFTMVVFIKHNNTPVVKASTRELSYMILLGMYLCYMTTFALVAMPTQETCFVTRVLPGFSFAVIYASLVTKTNRIARILAGSKKRIITKKPRFMSSSAQVVISIILILIEAAIIGFMLFSEPADSKLDYPMLDKVILVCNTTSIGIIAPLGFDFFLIAMCTVYAIKTRNVPENFNEAKFIGFTMYTTLVIWIAFVPIYFGSDLKVLTMCLCISFSALVALVLLFFPKLYIILFKPEKNNRSFFTTAKNVRCHIGYVPTLGISRHSSHSTSEFSVDSPRNHSLEVKHHYNQHLKKDSASTEPSKSHHQPSTLMTDKSTSSLLAVKPENRRSSFNIFERFRISKQDKIQANVQQKIRAVRAAEALDRQTNRRVPGRPPPRQSSSSGMEIAEESENSSSGKMRLVQLLKQAYGDDVNKIPGFAEFVESAKRESRRVMVESAAQTSYDLLETWFPNLRHRLPRNEIHESSGCIRSINGDGGPMVSDECGENDFHRYVKQQNGSNSSLIHRFDQQQQTLWSTERDLNGINSNSNNSLSGLGITSRVPGPHPQDSQWSANYTVLSNVIQQDNSRQHLTTLRLDRKGSNISSPNLRKRPSSMSTSSAKVRASEESLLSGANSCVIEESVSSGGESSPSSGVVYKNIIINLGDTSQSSQRENDPSSFKVTRKQQTLS